MGHVGGTGDADGPRGRAVRPADPAKREALRRAEEKILSPGKEKRLRRLADKDKRPAVTAHVLKRIYNASRDADHFIERLAGWYDCEDDPDAGTLTIRLRPGGFVFVTYDVETRKLLNIRALLPKKRESDVRLLGRT